MESNLSHLTFEWISKCKYCVQISEDSNNKTPISCTKYSGSPKPISVNVATCLTCGEYRKEKQSTQSNAS